MHRASPISLVQERVDAWVSAFAKAQDRQDHALHERHRASFETDVLDPYDGGKATIIMPTPGTRFSSDAYSVSGGKTATFEVTVARELGSGASGSVYRCTGRRDGATFDCVAKVPKSIRAIRDNLWESHWLVGRECDNVIKSPGMGRWSTSLNTTANPSVAQGGAVAQPISVPILILDYAKMGTVYHLCQRHPDGIDRKTAARVIYDAALGLLSAEVVHRDLKPENILIGSDGESLLIDFGFAIPADFQQRKAAGIKLRGVAGTPTYLSPEQIGEANDLDSRSDVYTLGLILYEMVVGKPAMPYKPAGQDTDSYMLDLFSREPDLRLVTDPQIRDIIGKCTVKSRRARFQTMLELMDSLNPLF